MPGLSQLIMASDFVVDFYDRVSETGVSNFFNKLNYLKHGLAGSSNCLTSRPIPKALGPTPMRNIASWSSVSIHTF